MNTISFENIANTQIRIDGELFELPYRINKIIEFPQFLVFHSYPKNIDTKEILDSFNKNGRFSLYAISKRSKELLWKKQNVHNVFMEIASDKKESDFIDKKHYFKYLETFNNKDLVIVSVGEFSIRINANTGEEYDSTEIR